MSSIIYDYNRDRDFMSLYDYLGGVAGPELGTAVAAYAQEKGAQFRTKEISNPLYTGKIMMYQESFLREYFSKPRNTNESNHQAKLEEAQKYCDEQDKSTDFMLQYMQDVAKVDLDCVISFLEQKAKFQRFLTDKT